MPAAVAVPIIAAGVTALGSAASAQMQSSAARRTARLQTDALNESARLQDAAAKRALNSVQNQAFRDELLSNAASQGQYKADVAGLRNAYNMSGDAAFNQRSEFDSTGRTASNVLGQTTEQRNYFRDLMGYGFPQGSLNTYAAPAPLQRSALIIPEDQEYLAPVAPRPV
jgi:hypothetical protein